MTTLPPALAAHLAQEATSVCHCWRIARKDGVAIGFTDHDRTLTVDGTEFRPQTGFTASEARETLGLAADSVEVEGAISSEMLRIDDIEAGRYDGATVETLLVNWRAPTDFATIRNAVIGRIAVHDGRFVAELESSKLDLDKPGGRYFRRGCDAELGDGRCGVALDGPEFSAEATVAANPAADTVRITGIGGYPAGWFAHGILTAASGAAADTGFRVLAHRIVDGEAELVLWCDTVAAPVAGDAVRLTAGCDKTFATCKSKFSNHLNFRGFPHLPGNDAAYGYATEGQDFDGGPLVP